LIGRSECGASLGATAKSGAPASEAPTPHNIAARRPIWSEMLPKITNVATTAIGYTAKIAVVAA